jgi:translation initiation factor IF-3
MSFLSYARPNTVKNENEKFYRVNNYIKFSPVVVIDHNGQNLGPLPLQRAKDLAADAGLDLVEIVPNGRPPVCKVMDFGKFKFEQALKEKKQKKKQFKQSQVKEIRLSPSIQEHDIETKAKSAIKFLEASQKVNVKLEFKRRELAHQDLGFKVINNFVERLKDYGDLVGRPKFEGRSLFCVLEPKEKI